MEEKKHFAECIERLNKTTDNFRENAKNKRHKLNLRTARENLYDLVDKDSFLEYGAFAVAAQKSRKSHKKTNSMHRSTSSFISNNKKKQKQFRPLSKTTRQSVSKKRNGSFSKKKRSS